MSNWGSVRRWETATRDRLRRDYALRLHGWFIGLAVLAVMWAAAYLQMVLLLYFGSEALLAVAVEVAFGYVSARTALRMAREGWLSAAVRLTWKPLLGALACAVLLGGLVDHFLPQARSLPHAVQLLRGQ